MFEFGWETYAFLGGGLLFVILEVFFPSGGLLGIGATLCLIAGGWTAHAASGVPGLLVFAGLVAVLAPATTVSAIKILPYTPFGRVLILQPDASSPHPQTPGSDLDGLAGLQGTAVTALRPAGIALIGERRVDVVTRGIHIEKGASVRVVLIEGNRVVVDPAA